MSESHEGGCLCGSVRYRTIGQPQRASACHCTFCQRRSGSAFGMGAYFEKKQVEFLRGALSKYRHVSDESGRWIDVEFCPRCGGTITWTLEVWPDLRAIAVGSYDDGRWIKPQRHSWTRSAHPWMKYPDGVEVLKQSALPPPERK
jgi:hypothetical protein